MDRPVVLFGVQVEADNRLYRPTGCGSDSELTQGVFQCQLTIVPLENKNNVWQIYDIRRSLS